MPHPSTPSLPATSPHPHGSPPSAPLPLSTPPPRSARRRHRRPASASPVRASPASGFRIPPCSDIHTTAGATTHASGRSRSLHTPFPNKATSSVPHPSTPSLPATSPHPHGSPPSAPLPLSTPPPRSARRRRRRPTSASPVRASPASGFRIPPCSDIHTTAGATTHASGRSRSLHTPFPNKATSSVPHPSTPSLPATSPHPHGSPPSAPLPLSTPPPRSARRRRRRPTSASPVRASPASGFRIPPCSDIHTTAGATTHASGRSRSLRTSFANKAPWSMPTPSTPSLPATSPHPHGSPPSAPLPLSTLRLAPLAVGSGVPLPRRRCGLHPPPASASPLLRCPHHRERHYHPLRRWHSLHTSFPNKAASSMPTPSTPSLPATSPHPHGSPPSAPLPLSTPPSRSARRRRRRPTSASPVRASPASGFRIPPCSVIRTTASATTHASGRWRSLRTPFPNRRHGPGPILQHHPSLLHPLTLTARRLRRLCRHQPSASLRSSSTPPSRIRVAGAGFARLRLPHPPLLRCPHHRERHYPHLRSLALPAHFLPKQGAIVHAHSFNTIPPCYIPHPHGSPPSAPLPPSTPPPRSARRRRRRPTSTSPVRASHDCRQLLRQ